MDIGNDLQHSNQILSYLNSLSTGVIAVLVENSFELEKAHKILKQSDISKIAVYDPGSTIEEHKRSDILGNKMMYYKKIRLISSISQLTSYYPRRFEAASQSY